MRAFRGMIPVGPVLLSAALQRSLPAQLPRRQTRGPAAPAGNGVRATRSSRPPPESAYRWARNRSSLRRFGTAWSGLPLNYARRLAASGLRSPCRLEPVLTSVNGCPGGGTGRHGNFARCWPRGRAGSNPAPGTPAASDLTGPEGDHTLVQTCEVAVVVPPPHEARADWSGPLCYRGCEAGWRPG